MYKIHLINMPFANLNMPSIALTQLKSVVDRQFAGRVEVEIHYLNQEFGHFLGLELYSTLASAQASNAGVGDWLFRRIAFPDEADNAGEYLQRYFPRRDAALEERSRAILGKRDALERFLLRLIAKKRLAEADLVGFTSMFSQNVASFALARLVKAKNPAVTTVLGGANCEATMGRRLARHVESVDFVFSGPGLVSFPAFVGHRLAGDAAACQQIPGVFTAENCDSPHLQGHGQIGEELPIDVPVPLDYEPFLATLERNFPGGKVEPYLLFETSRGCWWGERSHCTFCGLNGGTMAYRAMPEEQALELLRDLLARYGDRCKRFESVDNILPRSYLKEVFPRLDTPAGVQFFYEVKADLKEREMDTLATAGVTKIQPGIESLSSSTLRLMGKGTTSFQNLAFLKGCLTYGIQPEWNLLIGFPGETEEVYERYLEVLPSLYHLPPPSGAFPVRFDRFSPYFTRAESYGLSLSPYAFYSFIYPFTDEVLADVAYFFEDRNYQSQYLSHVAAWQPRLAEAVALWRGRYRGADGKPAGRLALERGGAAVVDTRSGHAVEHRLEAVDADVLEALYLKGWPKEKVPQQVDAPEAAVAEAVERLGALGLLFEENGRLMSLVIDPERRDKVRAAQAAQLVGAAEPAAAAQGARG